MSAGLGPGYHLGERTRGGALLGLDPPQVLLLAGGLVALVLVPTATHTLLGVITGAVLAITCAIAAFTKAGGEPLHGWAAILGRFVVRRITGRTLWLAPLPLLTGTPPVRSGPTSGDTTHVRLAGRRSASLPRCLTGLDVLAGDRPDWAGTAHTLAPIGVVRDRRRDTLTVLIEIRGAGFSLLDPAEQHSRLAAWGHLLAQFGREVSPVVRLGWTLWSAPTAPGASDGHLEWLVSHSHDHPDPDAGETDYLQLLNSVTVQEHHLRVWVTVAAGHPGTGIARNSHPNQYAAALAAAKALTDRCTGIGLMVSAPLSPVQIAYATRTQADPSVRSASHVLTRQGLGQHAGLMSALPSADSDLSRENEGSLDGQRLDPVHVAPLGMDSRWDAVRVDGAWHRAFWICGWPSIVHDPRWLETLLMSPSGTRTIAVSYEPVSPRTSRRKITSEAVSVDSQLQLRERHDLRIPVGLQAAHTAIDQRESELAAGHTEVGLLALIVVTESDLERLDAASQELLDQAAQAGITDLRALHGRHDAAWACTLPLGRVPDRELLHGIPG